MALRGAARGAGIAVPDTYADTYADPHADADADAFYLLVEPASAAGARRFVVFVVRLGLVVRVLVRPRGQLAQVARPC